MYKKTRRDRILMILEENLIDTDQRKMHHLTLAGDCGLDSLDKIELLMTMEEEFEKEQLVFDDQEIDSLWERFTVKTFIQFVEEKLKLCKTF